MKNTKFIWIFVAILILIPVLYLCANLFGTPWGRIYHEKMMTSYLDEKYHSTFIVHTMRFNALGSGYEGTAYPKKDSSLSFTVKQSSYEDYADMYPSAFWKSEQSKPMKAFILNLFPDLDRSSFTVEPQFGELVGPHIPTLQSIKLDVGVNCLMMIKLEQNWFNLSTSEQENEMEKITNIRTHLQKHHFPVFVEFFYNTQTVDNNNLKAIFITENGEIVER